MVGHQAGSLVVQVHTHNAFPVHIDVIKGDGIVVENRVRSHLVFGQCGLDLQQHILKGTIINITDRVGVDITRIELLLLIKQRKESAEQYKTAGRPELAGNELAEAAVLEEYLPKQLGEEELEARLKEIIAGLGASSPADMGKVMGAATKQLAGLADGRAISALVKKLLA